MKTHNILLLVSCFICIGLIVRFNSNQISRTETTSSTSSTQGFASSEATDEALATENQNVLLIIADDYGIDMAGLYGAADNTPPTPNIDALRDSGVLFTNAWVYPTCSPTRSSLLTGQYGFRTGIGTTVAGRQQPGLDLSTYTLPNALDDSSDSTIPHANIGKWHLSTANQADDYPNQMGWSHYSGALRNMDDYFSWTKTVNGVNTDMTTYGTSEYVDDALNWLDENDGDEPWLLWVALNAPHTPFHLPPNDLHSYDDLSGTETHIQQNPDLYYFAMVEAMDTEIGRLINAIPAEERAHTTIIFMGDNGSPSRVAQTPFDRSTAKSTLYEGGIRVPFIVSSPLTDNPGRDSDALINSVDVFSSVLDLTGSTTDASTDSVSFVPYLIDNDTPNQRAFAYSETFNSDDRNGRTIRNDEYKLLLLDGEAEQFFNLTADPHALETLNVSQLDSTEQANYCALHTQLHDLIATEPTAPQHTIPTFCDSVAPLPTETNIPTPQATPTPELTPLPTATATPIENDSAWMMNTTGELSIVAGGVAVNVTDVQVETVNGEQYQCITASGIPNYETTIDQTIMDQLMGRPRLVRDFGTGGPTISLGDVVPFGADIGYTPRRGCTDVDEGYGYWPQGPTCPTDQEKSWCFAVEPQSTTDVCTTRLGPIGSWVNGVSIYNWQDAQSYNNDGIWDHDAPRFEIYDLDICMGHSGRGNYHHHSHPTCLQEQLQDDGSAPSPIYGYAADGYPIYGPWDDSDVLAQSCWKVRDYDDPNSPTGCGVAGERSCLLVDQWNVSQGTRLIPLESHGPSTDTVVQSESGNPIPAVSGAYFQDYYYDPTCTIEGNNHLDHHNGHYDPVRGYHYHITMDDLGDGDYDFAFPYYVGPTYAGELPNNAVTSCGLGGGAPSSVLNIFISDPSVGD